MADLAIRPPTALRKLFDSVGGGALTSAKPHVTEGAHVLRSVGESAIVGAALGYASINLKHGLDMPVPKTTYNIPLDAAIGVVGALGAVAMAKEGIASDLRNASAAGVSIYAFRKMQAFAQEKHAAGPKKMTAHGDFGAEDPILAAARSL